MQNAEFIIKRSLNGRKYALTAAVISAGDDLCVLVTGGDSPHIGSVSISQPRPSLGHPWRSSATTSTFNFPGHMDDAVGNRFAAELATRLKKKVVVLCGIHIDHITQDEISLIKEMAEELLAQVHQNPDC